MIGYIYCHTSPSGKKYIGQTLQTPEKRWGKNGIHYDLNTPFGKAIAKYGWDLFSHEILLTLEANSREELIKKMNIKEEEYIISLNTYVPNGYNCHAIKHSGNVKTNERPVWQFDFEKNFIKEFPSVAAAAREIDLKQAHTNIVQCCQHKLTSCGGYYWEYANNECNPRPLQRQKTRTVYQLDKDTLEVLTKYPTLAEAAKAIGLKSSSSITHAIKDNRTAGGYRWKYEV